MKIHPAATIFPMMAEAALADLAASIKAHGQLEPIVVFDDSILDGRNRWAACELAGVQPKTRALGECDSPTDYVMMANKERRHLSGANLSVVAVEAATHYAREAADRQRAAGTHGVKGAEHGTKGGRGKKTPFPMIHGEGGSNHSGESLRKAAEKIGAGINSTEDMAAIKKKAPEVFEAVKAGVLHTVADAKRVASEAEPVRKATLGLVRGGATVRNALSTVGASAELPAVKLPPKRSRVGSVPDAVEAEIVRMAREHHQPHEIVAALGVRPRTVTYIKSKHGLTERAGDPLHRLREQVVEFRDALEGAAGLAHRWEQATPEQSEALAKELGLLVRVARALSKRLRPQESNHEEER